MRACLLHIIIMIVCGERAHHLGAGGLGEAVHGAAEALVVVDPAAQHPASEKDVRCLGWPKRCNLAHALLSKCSYERLKLAQLLIQLGAFLTWPGRGGPSARGPRPCRSPPRLPPARTYVESGRIVASETEAPNMLANPV
jgi:hypothetical protein